MTKAETPYDERDAINKNRGYALSLVFLFVCILGFGLPYVFSGGTAQYRSSDFLVINGSGDFPTAAFSPSPLPVTETLLLPVTGPTFTPTITATISRTPSSTQPSPTLSASDTATFTPSFTATLSPTFTLTPTNTLRPSNTPKPPTPTATRTLKPTGTSTPSPTNTRTPIPSDTPTRVPTNTPVPPTNTPIPSTNTPIPTRTNTPIPSNTSAPTNPPAPTNPGGCQSAPPSPTLNYDLGENGNVTLTWNRVDGAIGYQVYRSTNGNPNRARPFGGPINGTSKTDTIPPDSTYTYFVVAFNACGNGISNVVTVTR